MKRCLYIDGTNLYGGMSELLPAGNYIDFSSFLSVMQDNLKIDKVKFYATYMRIDPSQATTHRLTAKAQVEFLNSAKSCPTVEFHKGYYSGFNKEKGIDMRMGLDMYIDGHKDLYDELVVMSGDADFNYAVDKVKTLGKRVHMMAFASRYPFGMESRSYKKFVYDYNSHFTERILPSMKRKPKHLQIVEISSSVKIAKV